MNFDRLSLLPLLPTIFVPATVALTYWLSASRGQVNWFLPYISETALWPPQSFIFAVMFNASAVCIALTIYYRFKLVDQFYRQMPADRRRRRIQWLNHRSWPFGMVLAIGLSVVGTSKAGVSPDHHFLVSVDRLQSYWLHMTGAYSVFVGGSLLCAAQTWMSFLMVADQINSLLMAQLRLVITVVVVSSVAVTSWCGVWADKLFHGRDQLHWGENDGGYVQHVISAGTEWILVLALVAAVATAVGEMQIKRRLMYKFKYVDYI